MIEIKVRNFASDINAIILEDKFFISILNEY